MDEWIWQFTRWIYTNYGRTGCLIAFFTMIAFITLVYFLLSRLPEPKEVKREDL